MIKLKTKIVGKDEDNQYVKCTQYKTKHTNSLEHIVAIGILVEAIMDNQEDMTITELCKIIKNNYKFCKEDNK